MKRFLAGMLAIVLVFTSASYMQVTEVQAMTQDEWKEKFITPYTTTAQYQGLNFETIEHNYYFAEDTMDQLPATFEATVRVSNTLKPYRAGMIMSNSEYGESKDANETGTFSVGFYKGMVPFLYIDNNASGNGVYYMFDPHDIIGTDEKGKETISGHTTTTYKEFHTGEWAHLAIVNDAANQTMTCYLNGEYYATATGTDGSTYYDATNWEMSKPMIVGSDYRLNNPQQFIGDIKNIALYADARTEEDVANDCTAMKAEDADYQPDTTNENLMACYVLGIDTETGRYPKTLEDLSNNTYDMKTYDWLYPDEVKQPQYSYSMAVVGDPQVLSWDSAKYATSSKESVQTTFRWVRDNVESKNMQFVFNMGDTVDSSTGSTAVQQWTLGSAAVKQLDGVVPYSMVRGNHDSIAYYNEYYSYAEYKDSLAGSYDENMLNTYQKFEVGDIKYLVLNLDFGVGADSQYFPVDENDDRIMADGSGNPDKVLEWANKVVKENPGYNVILTTHGYTNANGERLSHDTTTTTSAPTNSSASKEGYQRAYSGEDIYQKLVKDNSNIVLVLSGHVGTENVVQRTVTREDGSNVVEMLVNPQTTDQYLDVTGLVAMMYFSEANTETNKQDVTIQYYATLRDKYYRADNQNITFTLDVIDSSAIENADGSVVIARDEVSVGEDTVSAPEDYKDYLFAGWYTDATCTTAITDKTQVNDNSYAKFWPKDLLDVKVQITNGIVTGETNPATTKYNDKYVIRFVSSLQNLDPAKAGFEVTLKDGTPVGTSTSKTAFKGIESTNAGSTYDFSPKVISELSEWFITAKMPVDPDTDANTDYVVRAYWTTPDGTMVYGDSRCVSVMDNNVLKAEGEQHTLNLTVNGELDVDGTYTASFVSSYDNTVETDNFAVSGAAVKVLNAEDGYSNVRITLPEGSVIGNMASLTKITIDGTDSYGMFRNYNTSHVNLDDDGKDVVLAPHADTSWYYASEDTSKFVIASSADLYGLATMVNTTTDVFAGDTVTLVRDITVNTGTDWMNATSVDKAYVWYPIGRNQSGTSWKGCFDGDGNSISGLYTVHRKDGTGNYTNPLLGTSSNAYVGLFGTSIQGSVIKNIAVTESYFDNDLYFLGSIVGYSKGTEFENLYSNATIVNNSSALGITGGLIGRLHDNVVDNDPFIMKSCWFDGDISVENQSAVQVGGLVGSVFQDKDGVKFIDCLYTGSLESAGTNVGGFYGTQSDGSSYANKVLEFVNCISAGDITATNSGAATVTGSVAGTISRSKTFVLENCYSVCEVSAGKTDAEAVEYGTLHANNASKWVSWITTKENLAATSLEDLFGEDHVWTTVEGMDVPVLAEFAHTWQKLNNNN